MYRSLQISQRLFYIFSLCRSSLLSLSLSSFPFSVCSFFFFFLLLQAGTPRIRRGSFDPSVHDLLLLFIKRFSYPKVQAINQKQTKQRKEKRRRRRRRPLLLYVLFCLAYPILHLRISLSRSQKIARRRRKPRREIHFLLSLLLLVFLLSLHSPRLSLLLVFCLSSLPSILLLSPHLLLHAFTIAIFLYVFSIYLRISRQNLLLVLLVWISKSSLQVRLQAGP